jgi:hypothetical protein
MISLVVSADDGAVIIALRQVHGEVIDVLASVKDYEEISRPRAGVVRAWRRALRRIADRHAREHNAQGMSAIDTRMCRIRTNATEMKRLS